MNNVRTIYPKCSLCEGKGRINLHEVAYVTCPACNYETWKPNDYIDVLLTRDDADKLRKGGAVETRKEMWQRQMNAWKYQHKIQK